MRTRAFTPSARVAGLIALACLAAYAPTLGTSDFIHDDQAIIAGNPLLHQGLRGLPKLLTTGYWEAVQGATAPVKEYRPLLMLTFLLQTMTTGFGARAMHAANLLLHVLVCLLLWRVLLRRMDQTAAAAGAVVFAVMPVHTEAVSMLTGRSELLSAFFLLGAWLCLDGAQPPSRKREWAGTALFFLSLLVKESSVLFPALLAMSDWAFHAKSPLERGRLRLHAWLLACLAVYFLLRDAVLSGVIHGGVPYFTSGRLVASLTVSKFMVLHYLWPALSGTGLCSDYTRPLIPDSGPSSADAWLCLIGLAAAVGAAAFALWKRRAWGFWALGPAIFLLPTSHMFFPLDTLGAQRFLYIPTIGLAAGLGHLASRLRARASLQTAAAACVVIVWYAYACVERNSAWNSRLGYYEAAVACNPVTTRARSALGASLIMAGRVEEGRTHLLAAMKLDPRHGGPHYNLARLAWERGEAAEAERHLRKSLELDSKNPDAWALLALVLESRGRLEEAASSLEKALELWPWHSLAEFNLGRLRLLQARPAQAAGHFKRFLELAPDDADAPRAEAVLRELGVKTR